LRTFIIFYIYECEERERERERESIKLHNKTKTSSSITNPVLHKGEENIKLHNKFGFGQKGLENIVEAFPLFLFTTSFECHSHKKQTHISKNPQNCTSNMIYTLLLIIASSCYQIPWIDHAFILYLTSLPPQEPAPQNPAVCHHHNPPFEMVHSQGNTSQGA
jgi:hypothetical protein